MRRSTVRSSDIARCPVKSLLPSHYNEDGSCGCPARRCLRCDKDLSSEVPMTVFKRHGHSFVPVSGVVMCTECGGNGANTLTDEESRTLPGQG